VEVAGPADAADREEEEEEGEEGRWESFWSTPSRSRRSRWYEEIGSIWAKGGQEEMGARADKEGAEVKVAGVERSSCPPGAPGREARVEPVATEAPAEEEEGGAEARPTVSPVKVSERPGTEPKMSSSRLPGAEEESRAKVGRLPAEAYTPGRMERQAKAPT
jgi:hypothetical protein